MFLLGESKKNHKQKVVGKNAPVDLNRFPSVDQFSPCV